MRCTLPEISTAILKSDDDTFRQPWENDPYRLISWWDMERFSAEGFFGIACELSILVENSDRDRQEQTQYLITPEQRETFLTSLKRIEAHCKRLDLKVSLRAAQQAISSIEGSTYFGNVGRAVEQFKDTIEWEAGTRFFLPLTSDEADRYTEWSKGWEKILVRFPDAIRDVEEMQKGFALARYPASMFHALHVAEWGAIRLGNHIGVTDPKRGWGPTERKLRELIKAGHAALPPSLAGSFEFLEQMNREIDSMVLAWRHKIDHAANHLAVVPTADFTADVAKHIIDSVRIFMQRLIEGIPESP